MTIALQGRSLTINAVGGLLDSRTPTGVQPNRPPVIATIPPLSMAPGSVLDISSYGSDPDGDALAWGRTLVQGDTAPAGITLSANGVISVASNVAPSTTPYVMQIYCDDARQATSVTDAGLMIEADAGAEPAVGVPYSQAAYGTSFKKIVNPALIGNNSPEAKTFYANLQAWNSNRTLLMLSDSIGFAAILDASTYEVRIAKVQLTGNEYHARWSPTEPYVLYYVGTAAGYTGPCVLRYAINPSTWAITPTVVGNFPTYTHSSAEAAEAWHEIRVHPTTGDLWIPMHAIHTASGHRTAWAYNITTQTSSTAIDIETLEGSDASRSGEVNVTPDCDGIVLGFGAGRTQPAPSGFELYDLTGAFVRRLVDSQGHYDLTRDSAGNSWVVYYDNAVPNVSKAKINGAAEVIVPMVAMAYDTVSAGIHVSARATSGFTSNANQFVVVSDYASAAGNTRPFKREIFKVFMDSTAAAPHVERLLQHRSIGTDYDRAMPFATVSNDGSRIAFGSNWNGAYKDAYVVGP